MSQTCKPLVIPVFIPHLGCPHQCAFCNQSIITNQTLNLPGKSEITDIIEQYLKYKGERKKVELAFFGGNFLGLPQDTVLELLDIVNPWIVEEKINGIRFSTRPDTITPPTLDLIRSYKISAIEIGVQSMNDEVLLKSKRGHSSKDTETAINLLKQESLKIGVQVMLGLPYDNEDSLIKSTKQVAGLAPDFARIYPLMVLKGSLIATWYEKKLYKPLSLEKSVDLTKSMYKIFKDANIDVIRMGLQSSEMMNDESMVLAGPWHPAFGQLVFSSVFYDMVCQKIDRINYNNSDKSSDQKSYKNRGLLKSKTVILDVHPNSESQLRGDKNLNLEKLHQRYPHLEIIIRQNNTLLRNQIEFG